MRQLLEGKTFMHQYASSPMMQSITKLTTMQLAKSIDSTAMRGSGAGDAMESISQLLNNNQQDYQRSRDRTKLIKSVI